MGRVSVLVCMVTVGGWMVSGEGREAKVDVTKQIKNAKLGKEEVQWQCGRGMCGRWDGMATREGIENEEMSVIKNYLKDEEARLIVSTIRKIPDNQWVQIDNKRARVFGKHNVTKRATVEMDYKMLDLQGKELVWLRQQLEPYFTDLFQGEGQKLSLFVGKYSQGSFVTSHTDGGVVTLDGNDRYDRKRAFILYLNEEWSAEDGGLFMDEEDKNHPTYSPSWNSLVTFKVPRWHLVTPVTANKIRWSVYGWSLEERVDIGTRFFRFLLANPLVALVCCS
ncbi:hypothetical protein GUITHDRAFT_107400 [Guillardia theta CCMP2712]|uniref:Prolyl 4-hydroxylase alpha subunit domain-containing protein n=2 Tax=Guillardia theta TaxID=55529 RepID=L1JE69_GUITC|nr:hypothetical protein GUITHDRAFT_107400 [Guillardia theta CCMP2712]EKX46617.1 hypothetical protein GUITHDRAFT_107400 [Guillardia theta CCMP2712]|eukprot:XP_005833597.1 hypothetical protein GUITHDRAFT_107400 [Guillardia theta CCMP2712]